MAAASKPKDLFIHTPFKRPADAGIETKDEKKDNLRTPTRDYPSPKKPLSQESGFFIAIRPSELGTFFLLGQCSHINHHCPS